MRRLEKKLKDKLAELEKATIARNKLIMQVSALKRILVDQCNYVGIVHIIRSLGYKNRNLLFKRFLERHPGDFLFVMAFADESSSSYEEAEKIAETAYQGNIYDIKNDVLKERDSVLCQFLDYYNSKEDLQYVYNIVERCDLNECSWMESYKRVVSRMIDSE